MNRIRAERGPHPGTAHRARVGFTLIELLVVVVIISIVSAILLPTFITARDRARIRAAAESAAAAAPRPGGERARAPVGVPPVLRAVELRLVLDPSYHRVGMDVFTRYRVDGSGNVLFRAGSGRPDEPLLLMLPFPDHTVEARDVRIRVREVGPDGQPGREVPGDRVVFDRTGIYFLTRAARNVMLRAEVGFTAFGRERFDYALPPSELLESLSLTLELRGAEARTVPDESLQPSASGPHQLRWEFRNLVSDRKISVLIPAAQAPLARMLLLCRLVAVAVLLFGAGFWFLSEQVKPGQLDAFRLGHFLLLALTYSVFFVVFAVLELHGGIGTPVAMGVSAVVSLPLLVLHVARVLDFRFAATWVLPLALVTLGLVINGVYGGPARDYGFIAATVMLLGWVTVFYPSWAAGRERHRRECTAAYLAHRRALAERISGPLAARLAELHPVVGRLAELQQLPLGEPRATDSGPPAAARDLLGKLAQEHERLTSRLSYLPPTPGPETPGILRSVDAEATSLEEQLVLHLARLKTDLLARTGAPEAAARLEGARSGHCAACGQAAPGGRYCAQCGTLRPRETTCEGCSARLLLPLHLIPAERREGPMHCPDCGGRLQWRSYQDAERGPKIVGEG